MRKGFWIFFLGWVLESCFLANPAQPAGHGPLFGLATPTNAKGAWSIDFGWMGMHSQKRTITMARLMVAYGLTRDFQVSLSGPLSRNPQSLMSSRALAMMPMTNEVEMMIGWRFRHRDTGIGKRSEDTAYLALSTPNEDITRPGAFIAIAHGEVSRTWYLWGGLGYKTYTRGGNHPGNEWFYSLVIGYRPKSWQWEYPKPDLRVLLELIGELQEKGVRGGIPIPTSGGHRLFLAPGLLGTYKNWGFSFGVGFPLLQNLPPRSFKQNLRFGVDITKYF